jgi:predicted dehydrogenase/glycosyltransferase involved in cell wall biosynthesis
MSRSTAVVLATDSPEPSGVGRVMLTLAAALPPDFRALLLFPDHDAGRALVAEADARGLSARTVPDADWRRALAGAALVNVHAGIGWEGHGLVSAARDAGAAVVRTEHLPWLITDPAQRDAYASLLPQVDAVIAVGEAAAASWRPVLRAMDAGDAKLVAIPNGIEASPPATPATPATPAPQGGVILCVARFTPQKNHDILIDSMRRLRATHPDARLTLVGTGPEMERVRALADGLDGVAFLGRRDDVPDLLDGCTLVVLPSSFEGLPLVVLEAMRAGRPVVASRIGSVTEALGSEHPWLVPQRDPAALAAALADALDRPETRAEVAGRQAARFAGRFTARRMADDTARLYASTLENRKRSGRMTTRLGFIGAGGIAHRHFGTLGSMDDVRIVAVADPDAARADEAARLLSARAFPDHETMLAEVDLDAVYICVPPFAHGAPERACIARGLPFFVEKPLTLDIALAEAIASEVEAAGLLTAVGYHWRYLDTVQEARTMLEGNPVHLMTGFWLDQTPPPRWWWREDASGGQIVEQATHIIDLARFLAGDVTSVFARAARRDRADFDGLDVPTATTVTLEFASGAVATLSATCLLRWSHRIGLHVFSDALAIELTDHDIMVDVGRGRPVRPAEGDPVWREDRDFVEAVQGRENRIRSPYAEALETHRVALAVSRSATTGDVVKMEALRTNPQPFFRQAAETDGGAAAPAEAHP